MSITLQRHGKPTVQGYVRDTIRASIFAGDFKPGDRLLQADIAKQLDVSTTPVREALRELAMEGLLRIDDHRGAVVRSLTAEELHEIYELRTVLEPLALRRAVPRITEEELGEADELLTRMVDEPSQSRWTELNRRFHHIFLEACGSERLERMIRNLQDCYAIYTVAAMRYGDADFRARADVEHRALLDAVRAGDADAATSLLLEHISLPLPAAEDIESQTTVVEASGGVEEAAGA